MDINIDTSQLREAATQHGAAAEVLRSVPFSHAAIQESLDSLGPIFASLSRSKEVIRSR